MVEPIKLFFRVFTTRLLDVRIFRYFAARQELNTKIPVSFLCQRVLPSAETQNLIFNQVNRDPDTSI